MQNTRKVISLVLAIVMLASVFTLTVSAGAPAPTGSYKINISYELTDATTGEVITKVTPGQTVKLLVYSNSSVANDEMLGFVHSVYFDESVYTYQDSSAEWLGVKKWIDATNSSSFGYNATTGASIANYTKQAAAWTADEKAAHPGWTSLVYVKGTQYAAGEAYTVAENANNAMYSLTFTVNETATEGMDASFGCPASVLYISRTSYNYCRTNNTGTIGSGEIQPATDLAVSVAPASVPSIIVPMSTQIRFDKNGTAYANTFDVRTRAKIADADWDALFTGYDDAKTKIAKIGFVYAPSTTTFDATTAQNVAKGTTTAGYVDYQCEYIQDNDGYYMFTCMIEDIADADKAMGVTALAYMQVGENWYFFDAETVVSYNELYTDYYSQAFPA